MWLILMGLSGEEYIKIDTDLIPEKVETIRSSGKLLLGGAHIIPFSIEEDLVFHFSEFLPYHANGLEFQAILKDGQEVRETYYSVGGGFVATEDSNAIEEHLVKTPYPCHKAEAIEKNCSELKCSVSELVWHNEQAWRNKIEIREEALFIWEEIKACIFRGNPKKRRACLED